MALTTQAEVFKMLRWGTVEQTKYSSHLDLYINAASLKLEARYGPLEEVSVVRVVDGDASLSVPARNLTAVTLVEVDADGWETVPSGEYTVDVSSGLIYGSFARGRQNYRITYTAGFDTLPDDVTYAATALVVHMWAIASQRAPGLPEDFTAVPTGFLLPNVVKEAMATYDTVPGFA